MNIDVPYIDTRPFGTLTAVNTVNHFSAVDRDSIQVIFDTGVTMFVPLSLFETMQFGLQEVDP